MSLLLLLKESTPIPNIVELSRTGLSPRITDRINVWNPDEPTFGYPPTGRIAEYLSSVDPDEENPMGLIDVTNPGSGYSSLSPTSGFDNSGPLQALLDGHPGILYFPPGFYEIHEPIETGNSDFSGFMMLGGTCNDELYSWPSSNQGISATLVAAGNLLADGTSAGEALFTIRGNGVIEGIAFQAHETQDHANKATGPALKIAADQAGTVGKCAFDRLAFKNWNIGIQFGEDGTYDAQGDVCNFGRVFFDECTDGVVATENNNMVHHFHFVRFFNHDGDCFWYKRGGNLHCDYVFCATGVDTLLRLGVANSEAPGSSNSTFTFMGMKFDANCDDVRLVHTEFTGTKANVTFGPGCHWPNGLSGHNISCTSGYGTIEFNGCRMSGAALADDSIVLNGQSASLFWKILWQNCEYSKANSAIDSGTSTRYRFASRNCFNDAGIIDDYDGGSSISTVVAHTHGTAE